MLERVSSICTRLLLTRLYIHRASERVLFLSLARFVCAPAKSIIDGFGETLVHSGGRRVHACQEAEISIFIALHNCLASFRCGRRGKNPNLLPPPGEWSERESERAHTQKQHHHLESESISILFASDLFLLGTHTKSALTNRFYGGQWKEEGEVRRKKCGLRPVLEISADHANESCFAVRKSKRSSWFPAFLFITTPTTAGSFCAVSILRRLLWDISTGAPALVAKNQLFLYAIRNSSGENTLSLYKFRAIHAFLVYIFHTKRTLEGSISFYEK